MAELSEEYKTLCDNLSAETDLNALWKLYKQAHDRTYAEEEEEQRRFERFTQNVQTIIEHNAKFKLGQVTYQQGINKFTDMFDEEMKKFRGGR